MSAEPAPAAAATGATGATGAAAVKLDRLTKLYGDVTALDDVSVSVGAGRFLVLLGPSGSGKSTLIRCLAGIERPDAGSITIDGQLVAGGRRQTPRSAAI